VEDELDLHGLTVQQAEEKLRLYLYNSRTDRQRVVRVIHGKGLGSPNQQSVLRIKVTEWLSQSEHVLAFCPAGAADGGSGAVRVLLKRRTSS
jgi:DNA-nicking Smr family endonuclease